MGNIDTAFISKTVNKAFWPIAIYAYVIVPLYCFAAYGYLPSSIGQAKDLWDMKEQMLDFVKLLNA